MENQDGEDITVTSPTGTKKKRSTNRRRPKAKTKAEEESSNKEELINYLLELLCENTGQQVDLGRILKPSTSGEVLSTIQDAIKPECSNMKQSKSMEVENVSSRSNNSVSTSFNLNQLLKIGLESKEQASTSSDTKSRNAQPAMKENKKNKVSKNPMLLASDLEQLMLEEHAKQKQQKQSNKKKNVSKEKVESKADQKETSIKTEKVQVSKNENDNAYKNEIEKGSKNNKETQRNRQDSKFVDYLTHEELLAADQAGVLIKGIIRINIRNFQEAYVSAPDKGLDILVESMRDRNRSLEGDEVYLVLKPEKYYRANTENSDMQRTASVVGICTKNHNRTAVGILKETKDKSKRYAFFFPRDSRFPRVRIFKDKCPADFFKNPDKYKKILMLVKIVEWSDIRHAEGIILNQVGVQGDLEAETLSILLENDVITENYHEQFKKYYPKLPYSLTDKDLVDRLDLRQECIFTIDPATARDLDDAVSCKILPNGNYEIGVHISDVTYFLRDRTPLDYEVCKRATTVYLVQEVYHMLPKDMCQLCSLLPGEDKLALSVIWEINDKAEIVNKKFTRTVINSCVQLAYEDAQQMLTNPAMIDFDSLPTIHGGHTVHSLVQTVNILNKIAVILREKRFANGALRIDQIKINFDLDQESGLPLRYHSYVNMDAHRLIEEFMLLANVSVAEKIYHDYPTVAFLRCHPAPLMYMLYKLQKTFEKYGIIIDITTAGGIHSSIARYWSDGIENVAQSLVLNNALAKPMARARYFCAETLVDSTDKKHYALNVPLYTHFTSPIRRYADVMVHRLLCSSLGYRPEPDWTVEEVAMVAANCNRQKYSAKRASEQSTELYLATYIGLVGKLETQAVVCDVKDKSFDCIVMSTGTHYRIYVESLAGTTRKESDSDNNHCFILTWTDGTVQVIEMFSVIRVSLTQSSKKDMKILCKLLQPEIAV